MKKKALKKSNEGPVWYVFQWMKLYEDITSEYIRKSAQFLVRSTSIMNLAIQKDIITATIEVHDRKYNISIKINSLEEAIWLDLLKKMIKKADLLCHLVYGNNNDEIQIFLMDQLMRLLPQKKSDIVMTCSCDDLMHRGKKGICEHGAILWLIVAREFDRSLFQWLTFLGMSRDDLGRLLKKLFCHDNDSAYQESLSEHHVEKKLSPQPINLEYFWVGQAPMNSSLYVNEFYYDQLMLKQLGLCSALNWYGFAKDFEYIYQNAGRPKVLAHPKK